MLHKCIISLIEDLKTIETYFNRAKLGESFNFVLHVQPFTEQVDGHMSAMEHYKDEIIALPLMNEKKYLLMIQHLRELSVDCFFEKTSKKLFLDRYKAVNHDLQYIYKKTEIKA